MLYYIILCYIILYYIILCYIILYYVISYYIILYYIMLNYIILYYIILYYIILYYIILYYIILYYYIIQQFLNLFCNVTPESGINVSLPTHPGYPYIRPSPNLSSSRFSKCETSEVSPFPTCDPKYVFNSTNTSVILNLLAMFFTSKAQESEVAW